MSALDFRMTRNSTTQPPVDRIIDEKKYRLSAFEEFMLFEDRPQSPCWILARVAYRRSIGVEIINRAINMALVHHPRLNSIVVDVHRRPGWKTIQPPIAVAAPLGRNFNSSSMPTADLQQQSGIRFYYRNLESECKRSTEIYFHAHHACTDAKGLISFARQVDFIIKSLMCPEVEQSGFSSGIDQRLLAGLGSGRHRIERRRNVHNNLANLASKLWHQFVDAPRLLFSLRKRPVQVVASFASDQKHINVDQTGSESASSKTCDRQLEYYRTVFDAELFQRIRTSAKRHAVTVNDFLLTALFMAICSFKSRHEPDLRERSLIRVMVPVNLRDKAQEYSPRGEYR